MKKHFSRRTVPVFLLIAVSLAFISSAAAHAILIEAQPAANASVTGSEVEVKLKFNVRVDHARSRLTLVAPDGATQVLAIEKTSGEDILAAHATRLKPGAYKVNWQVLANDGHITRGAVPFQVKAG